VRVLITGASGQVGRALLDTTPALAEILALTREQLDITDGAAVQRAVTEFTPTVVINAAAYTAVDRAEGDAAAATAVNATGPRHLAEAVWNITGARLVQLSTDYVFDGLKSGPYMPRDPTNPASVYGRTKLAGEQAVREVLAGKAVVLRTSWIYAAVGKNFLLTMLRLMREQGAVRVVSDQRGAPTVAASVARALWRIAELPAINGVLHWTDEGTASWYEFACAIAEEALAARLLPKAPVVTAISTSEYPTPARRPPNSVLDLRESLIRLKLRPTPWRESLRTTLKDLARSGALPE
jgi:dTDP-4-dehydrorhamnose reductase